jgi:hypothetical protein
LKFWKAQKLQEQLFLLWVPFAARFVHFDAIAITELAPTRYDQA